MNQKTGKMKPGELWSFLNNGQLSLGEIYQKRNHFRSSINFNLALHEPDKNGNRYYAAVVYLMAKSLSKKSWDTLKRITGRTICNPLGIEMKGEFVCLDYLRAVKELETLSLLEIKDKSILEIGAGYGRTCHALISNYDIGSYAIVDLKPCLELSRGYLRAVLNDSQYEKIEFINIEQDYLREDYDLCISIDAFSEMPQNDVKEYLNYIDNHCRWFYVNTPIGKCGGEMFFRDQVTGETAEVKNLFFNEWFESIKITSESDVKKNVPKFIKWYTPGETWSCIHFSNAEPFMEYWQVLYRRKESKCGQQQMKKKERKYRSAGIG